MARVDTRRMHRLRTEFRTQCAARNEPCWICGQSVDYSAAHNDWANDNRFELDHRFPVSTHPQLQEDPSNFAASHAGCNRHRSNNAPDLELGPLSRVWA